MIIGENIVKNMKINIILLTMFISIYSYSFDNKLLDIIETVESNKNTLAIGDKGKAYGCLQIHICIIKDVNRIYKTNYVHKDAFYRDKAFMIAELYLKYWGKIYKKETGKESDNEIYCRIWNGGAYGWKKKQTLKYWNKIKSLPKNNTN